MPHNDGPINLAKINPATDCQEAIGLGVALLRTLPQQTLDYVLIAATNQLEPGERQWRLIFKPRAHLPPKDGEPITAGGELFILVNLDTQTACISGYGE